MKFIAVVFSLLFPLFSYAETAACHQTPLPHKTTVVHYLDDFNLYVGQGKIIKNSSIITLFVIPESSTESISSNGRKLIFQDPRTKKSYVRDMNDGTIKLIRNKKSGLFLQSTIQAIFTHTPSRSVSAQIILKQQA